MVSSIVPVNARVATNPDDCESHAITLPSLPPGPTPARPTLGHVDLTGPDTIFRRFSWSSVTRIWAVFLSASNVAWHSSRWSWCGPPRIPRSP